MNEQDFREVLHEALIMYMDDEGENTISRVQTFEEAGVITTNTGLIIKTEYGSEFQLTIVKSK